MPAKILPVWDLPHLQRHLQSAVDLEFWTIPFYMSAMYSIKDPSDEALQLIQAVVNEEMLHVQLAANVANAYASEDFKVTITPPDYSGTIPHIEFDLDKPNPAGPGGLFYPYSAEIGALDEARVNAMCLIEYPEWKNHERQRDRNHLRQEVTDYGSIGQFYRAVRLGMSGLAKEHKYPRGGVGQVRFFQRNYQNAALLSVDHDGEKGYEEALTLLDIIVSQGEGDRPSERDVPTMFRNTADDADANLDHYDKFLVVRDRIRNPDTAPATYAGVAEPPKESAGRQAQETLVGDFKTLCDCLTVLFQGGNPPDDFAPVMYKVGAAISNCWKNGAIPRFSN